jgi:hypothetical protein
MKVKKPATACLLSEKQIETKILKYLKTKTKIFAWKNNSVGVFDRKKGIYRMPNSTFIIRGISDIQGIIPQSGKILCIEVKTPARRKQLSPYQHIFLSEINSRGGIAFVATSIEEVQKVLILKWVLPGEVICRPSIYTAKENLK